MEAHRELLISNLKGGRVAVSGVVISKQENGFLMDDGTGQLVVLSDVVVEEGSYVRSFGQLIPLEERNELQASFVQNLDDIDKEVHRNVLKVLNGN
tara:strand:- start:1543 stop:1830 length:288 start_codon:yes stop_codon:yes gene_type:complete